VQRKTCEVGVTPDILRPCLVVLLRHASDGVAAVPRVNRVCPLPPKLGLRVGCEPLKAGSSP
jgi:hypothetical protein